jgi:CBS domain-containing protein
VVGVEIRDVMTESVVTAPPESSVRTVAELMRERNVGSVVLVDADLVVRTGDLELAHALTSEITRAALPEFYFHDRGG